MANENRNETTRPNAEVKPVESADTQERLAEQAASKIVAGGLSGTYVPFKGADQAGSPTPVANTDPAARPNKAASMDVDIE